MHPQGVVLNLFGSVCPECRGEKKTREGSLRFASPRFASLRVSLRLASFSFLLRLASLRLCMVHCAWCIVHGVCVCVCRFRLASLRFRFRFVGRGEREERRVALRTNWTKEVQNDPLRMHYNPTSGVF